MSEGRKQFSTRLSRFINLALLALVIGLVVACGSSPLSPSPTSVPAGTSVPGGTTLYTYRGHSSAVDAVAWSPDGKYIASGGNDGTVQVWDASDGHLLLTYRGQSAGIDSVAWSPDGKRIASGGTDGTVQIWEAI